MKTRNLKLLTLPLLFAMCGCSDIESGTYLFCVTENTSTQIKKTYEKFNGHASYKREFKNDTTISVNTTTESGTLVMKITGTDDDKEYYSGNLTENFDFTVNVPVGKYTLFVEGKEHSGSYKITWADKIAA